MSEFNRRSYEAGKSGGHSPISSTPGQPASMKDREVFWQGKAQAQWLKTPSSTSWSSPGGSPSASGHSGGGVAPRATGGAAAFSGGGEGISGSRSGASGRGKGAGAIVGIVIVVAIIASLGSSDKKEVSAPEQPAQSQPDTTPSTSGNVLPVEPPYTEDRQQVSQPVQDENPAPDSTAQYPTNAYDGNSLTPTATVPVSSAAPSKPAILAPATPAFPAVSYYATHKEGLGGGCDGTLVLSASGAEFDCSREHYRFAIASIAGPHKDGFILDDGKKYHFQFVEYSKDDAESLFSDWFLKAKRSMARQTAQGSAEATQTQP